MLRLLSIFALLIVAQSSGASEPLASITQIRALSPQEASRALPVLVEATVTFRNPEQAALIAHDGKEGIYVALPNDAGTELSTGTRVRIEGNTQAGGFLPIIRCNRIEALGIAPLPAPLRLDPSELFSPSLDCQWVQIPAIITGAEARKRYILTAEISGWTVKLLLPPDAHAEERAAQLMQRPVTIRGVVGSVFNEHRQLTGRHFFVPSFDEIVPSETTAADEEPKLRAINELLRSDATSQTRVRVRGVVTHATGDSLYLRGEGGSVMVRATNAGGFAPGTQVEVEGFAAVAPFRPILRATRVTALGHYPAPKPESLDLSPTKGVDQQAELVTLDADFLARRDGPAEEVILQCRAGNWFFEAWLAKPTESIGLKPNDRVQLTGICEFTSTRELPFSENADGLRLHLRNADDVTVLQRAPWWTLRHLLWALGIVGALAVVSLAWAALLRRRVAEQTRIIGTQIERAAVKDERQRIARELHDTIEQELAGVSMQIRNARQKLAQSPEEASTSVELAERMLRHCREEARTSIRDLRSVALEQRGLHGALEEFLTPLVSESGSHFSFAIQGEPRSLAGPVEIHLLRIASEAVTNAVRHAAATEIRVQLTYGADAVIMEVRDDGRGFDPISPAPRGHFGLTGIHERANKLGADLTIDTAPGAGTTIQVRVPIAVATREEAPTS